MKPRVRHELTLGPILYAQNKSNFYALYPFVRSWIKEWKNDFTKTINKRFWSDLSIPFANSCLTCVRVCMACRLTFITLGCYTQYNVMFICVLTELSINSEKNNKRSQAKKLSNHFWESIVFLILPLIKTFTSTFYYLVCVSDPLHAHTYKNSHTNKHPQTFDPEE